MELRYKRRGECNRCGDCCVNEDCEHFEMGEPATCLIYGKERPLKCTLFPEMPPIPKEFVNCDYWFEDTWEDNRIVKHKVS